MESFILPGILILSNIKQLFVCDLTLSNANAIYQLLNFLFKDLKGSLLLCIILHQLCIIQSHFELYFWVFFSF